MSELSQEVRAVREALDRLESELGLEPVSAAKLEELKPPWETPLTLCPGSRTTPSSHRTLQV